MNEVATPTWVKYSADIFFLVAFLVVFFFFKPDPVDENQSEQEEEAPNPLEKILVTDEDKKADDENQKNE